jgi:hypothetical protein
MRVHASVADKRSDKVDEPAVFVAGVGAFSPALSQLLSSPMSRIACVALSRWRAGGARKAVHGNSSRAASVQSRSCPLCAK